MELTRRFSDAIDTVLRLHGTQKRKIRGTPYVAHLLGVAGLALEHGATEDEAIAALLHDAVEDQGGASTREEIRRQFGDEVVAIVDGCSDTDETPKPPWKKRKEDYIRHVKSASPSVILVSASDKVHNVRSLLAEYRRLGEATWEHFRGGREGTLWYYRALVAAYREVQLPTLTGELVDELDLLVTELERLAGCSG